jgi:hypothetical protein
VMSSVLRIVNATSTEASLAPGIDQLHSTNSWPGALQVYRGWNEQPCNCSKQRVCSMSLNINAVACSILLRSKNGKKKMPCSLTFFDTMQNERAGVLFPWPAFKAGGCEQDTTVS